MSSVRKSHLIVLQRPPYAGALARAGVDTALAYAAFEQSVRVLFSGNGVLQLAPAQAPETIGRKCPRRMIESMPLYDLTEVYADGSAVAEHGLTSADLPAFITLVSADEIRDLYAAADHLLSF